MKRLLLAFLLCALLLPLACAKQPEPEPEPAPAIIAPAETAITMKLPLGARDEITRTIPAYTAGFAAADREALTFSVQSGDPLVAKGVLQEDGTLYVIAHGTGETKITVTAADASGEQASSVVSVKVSDARRTVALITLGVLAVVLLVLFGKPAAKKPEPASDAVKEEPEEEEKIPVVIFEEEPKEDPESKDNPERS